ncbi:hypothetical protein JCM10212_002548 [Sporobolomyces blumeae]
MTTAPLGQPPTLEAAYSRIAFLEHQLALAHRVVQERVGINLQELLNSAGAQPPPPTSDLQNLRLSDPRGKGRATPSDEATNSRPSTSGSDAPMPFKTDSRPPHSSRNASSRSKGSGSAPPPVDIGAFVLRALSLRKRLTIGEVDPLGAEQEFEAIVQGSGLTEKQEAQVREWAGLT